MKPKLVNWQLIENSPDDSLYSFVQNLITKFHGGDDGIDGVSFILMWRYNVKQDPDGFIWLADVSKSADKYRELCPHDIIIGINKDAWSIMDEYQKSIVIDCQLERIALSLDKKNEIKEDDRSRIIYRLRNPQVVEDCTIQRRHGKTLHDVHEFVFDKFNAGDAEEGSYAADKLDDGV